VDPWLIKGTVIEDILFSEEYRNAVKKKIILFWKSRYCGYNFVNEMTKYKS
jgi:hypothetical protein